MTDTIDARLDALIREVIPRRLRDAPLDDARAMHGELGIDSLGLMSLAFRIEEAFGIDMLLHADRVAEIFTIGELRRFVRDISEQETA